MKPTFSRVISNRPIAQDIYEMVLHTPLADKALPGQFVHLKIPNAEQLLLRRPLSIARSEESTLVLVYQVRGKGSKLLTVLQENDRVDMLGPLGNSFPVKSVEKALVIGGGIGAAPLENLLLQNKHIQFDALLGFRHQKASYRLWYFEHLVESFYLMTDDGSVGEKGVVTAKAVALLEKKQYDAVYVCGPQPMLVSLQKALKPFAVPCFVSLEERMGCGIGACLVCNCKVKKEQSWEYKRVCKDGPVFLLDEVMFDA